MTATGASSGVQVVGPVLRWVHTFPFADTKPADTKPAETKVPDTKPADTKAPDTKPAETKAPDTKPADTKPADTKAPDPKAPDTKAPDSGGGAGGPGEPSLLKWVSGGLALLTGLLGFFGFKGVALDRLLQVYPGQALLVFTLVGSGVVLALVAPHLGDPRPVRAHALVLGAAVLIALVARAQPWGDVDVRSVVLLGALAVGVGVWLTHGVRFDLPTTALLTATLAVALGLFTAMRWTIVAKATTDRPIIAARVDGSGLDRTLIVTYTAVVTNREQLVHLELSQPHTQPALPITDATTSTSAATTTSTTSPSTTSTISKDRARGDLLFHDVAYPDGSGVVERTVDYALGTRSGVIDIDVYVCDAQAPCSSEESTSVNVRHVLVPALDGARLAASIVEVDDGVRVTVTGTNLYLTRSVEVCVSERVTGDSGDGLPLSRQSAIPGRDGTMTWEQTFAGVTPGATILVRATVPGTGSAPCDGPIVGTFATAMRVVPTTTTTAAAS